MTDQLSSLNIRHVPLSVGDGIFNVHILEMEDTFMIWVNEKEISMKNIVMAASTRFSDIPTSIFMQGDISNVYSQTLASKLSKKTGKQVFVSCNIPASPNYQLIAIIEKELFQCVSKSKVCAS